MTNETLGEFLDVIGLDAEDLRWQDLSVCLNQSLSKFYQEYESNPRTAKTVDDMCMSCPVQKICLQTGIENKEWGVWGGLFLEKGRVVPEKNQHKSPEVWERIREVIG